MNNKTKTGQTKPCKTNLKFQQKITIHAKTTLEKMHDTNATVRSRRNNHTTYTKTQITGKKWNKDFADLAPFALCFLSGAWTLEKTVQNPIKYGKRY